jgi:chaperonin GroEL (HSP60 family)
MVTTEERGKISNNEAQVHNIRAAINVADTVRTTLGPAGMDKMMFSPDGNVIVTNDGATVLRTMDATHPGGKMMIEAAKEQEIMCKDGTTSVVVLAGQILRVSEMLLARGIHPNVVIRAFNRALRCAMETLPNGSESKVEADVCLNIARTALQGKATGTDLDYCSELCVTVAKEVRGDLDRVRVISQSGGSLSDSYVYEGVILNKEFLSSDGPRSVEGAVLLLNGGLEGFDMAEVQMQVTDPNQMAELKQKELSLLAQAASMVAGVVGEEGGIVFVRDRVHEAVYHYLAQQEIQVVSGLTQMDIDAIARLTESTIYHHIIDVREEDVLSGCEASEGKIGDLTFVSISGLGGAVTLVVRGATRHTVDEFERAFDDAVGVACIYQKDPRVVAGGGAAYSKMAKRIRSVVNDVTDMPARERLSMEAYADAVEIIPASIAANAGLDPLDMVMELRAQEGRGIYIDSDGKGTVENMLEVGIIEPQMLTEQILKSATEVALAILRIDDIIIKGE